MTQATLPSDWQTRFPDPYAVMGLAVTADDQRVLKRYRTVAKQLHPDRYAQAEPELQAFATQLFARLINPAYEKLKQESDRKEAAAMLRFQVRRLNREQGFAPQGELSQQLLKHPASGVDIFYEQVVSDLAQEQYSDFQRFEQVTAQLGELNLVYFQLKMGEVFMREKRTGLVTAAQAKPIQFMPTEPVVANQSYAQRHYQRGQQYLRQGNWALAVQELRDAIKIEADKPEYHTLLAIAYLQQNLPGMTKVYLRQALKLDPTYPLALKYAKAVKLEVPVTPPPAAGKDHGETSHSRGGDRGTVDSAAQSPPPTFKKPKSSGLFSRFRGKF